MDLGNNGTKDLGEGQVAEVRLAGASCSCWTYLRSADGNMVTLWLPEENGDPVRLPDGVRLEARVTVAADEILEISGTVRGTGSDGRPYAFVELDPSCLRLAHRRRFLRVDVAVPLRARRMPDGVIPDGEPAEGRTVTLSPGGLSMRLAGEYAPGDFLDVELALPGGRVSAVACVVQAPAGAPVCARFTYISDAAEAAVTRLVYQYQRMHGASRE